MNNCEEREKCPVCLLELGDSNKMITRCGHTLCGSCFVSNLNFTIRCPLCRQDMVDINLVQTTSPISSPPIDHNELPTNSDLRSVYTDLLLQIMNENASDTHLLRNRVLNQLHSFELDLRLVVSPLTRRLSLSDLPYRTEISSDSELDEILANLEIPEN